MQNLQASLKSFLSASSNSKTRLLLVRKGESVSNYGGLICGWLDPRLTITGRKQANRLFHAFHPHMSHIDKFLSSDLKRCTEFADIALGFNGVNGKKLLMVDRRLRELDFGKDDGLHYDTLPLTEKARIDSIDYQAPEGESWKQVRERFLQVITEQQAKTILAFSHGGAICSFTYGLGLENMVPPASVIGIDFDKSSPSKSNIEFVWEYEEGTDEQAKSN